MALQCRNVEGMLGDFHAGRLAPQASESVAAHLALCARCRGAARGRALERILETGAHAPVPEPSGHFMTRLHGAIEDCPPPRPGAAMAELLMRSGLRLVPAMAALVLLVSMGGAFFVPPVTDSVQGVAAEELLLEDHPLSADLMLAAITGETVER